MNMKATAVVVRNEGRAAEALRAAVGLTLRGARVTVVVATSLALPDHEAVRRAIGTLEALGQTVTTSLAALDGVEAVEVWS